MEPNSTLSVGDNDGVHLIDVTDVNVIRKGKKKKKKTKNITNNWKHTKFKNSKYTYY